MKKLIALVLALVCALCIFGCAKTQQEDRTQEPNTEQGNIPDNKENTSTETTVITDAAEEETKNLSEIPGGTRFIIEIRDRAKEEQLVCAEAEELFYEDETNRYFFNVIKSHYIMVTYNNGNSEDIVTALNAGRATIADLDEFGIEYHTEPKQ